MGARCAIYFVEGQKMTFEYWWKTTGIASMGMQPGDVYRAARDTALAAWDAATKAERDECSKVCEYRTEQSSDHPVLAALAEGAKGCAAAIRARDGE